jgi:catechol 2,3-dioxygenase-like lactoylglutathione lyase family enzyme
MPGLAGIHHVKIPLTDLARSRAWYERVFVFKVTMEFPEDGVVRGLAGEVPGLGDTLLTLRENPQAAAGCVGFDPVSFGVRDRAGIEEWVSHLDTLGIEHSPVIDATTGWLLVFDDPDGLQLHLYSWDAHGIDQSGRIGYGHTVA